jgi:hypothetical protein
MEHAMVVRWQYTIHYWSLSEPDHRPRPCEKKKKEAGHIRQLDVDPALVNLDHARLDNFPGLSKTGGQRA